MSEPELLSRKDLKALWREMAFAFGTELELPVDNGVSIVLKFSFDHQFGTTEIKIADLASHGSSLTGQGSSMQTTVETTLTDPLSQKIKISLPPLFPGLMMRFRPNVTPFEIGNKSYWLYYSPLHKASQHILTDCFQSIESYTGFFLEGEMNTFLTQTNTFLGKKNKIQTFMDLHTRFYHLLKT